MKWIFGHYIGIIIFKLLTGEFPFWSNNKNLALKFIQNGVYSFPKRVVF